MAFLFALLIGAQTAGYARPDLLVDTAWLAQHLNDPNVRIVDMRARGYTDGHIPEAVFLDNNWIRNPKAPPTFLPTPQEFEALMSRLGISNTTRVIAYDERGGIYAARLWWIMNHYGHANVALLDGGWVKWTADQRPITAAVPTVAAARFTVRPGTVKVVTADQVKASINNPTIKLIDARTQAEIEGKDLRNIKRGGYIESSIPVYWEDTLDPTAKTFKSAAEIAKLYRDKGITASDEVTVYCQVGMRASHDLFTLALIGHDLRKLSNYYGAWEEWGNREDTPIKTKQ
ncbi:MAG TPA: sulfurtransferase [Vicinamibacterales bacterium]|nr:sulfurtransferase [Vicinamibacterales bacterium]